MKAIAPSGSNVAYARRRLNGKPVFIHECQTLSVLMLRRDAVVHAHGHVVVGELGFVPGADTHRLGWSGRPSDRC